MGKILVTGCSGQVGTDLVEELARKFGRENIIGFDLNQPLENKHLEVFEKGDITEKETLNHIVKKYDIGTIYHLVSLLSAAGEKKPDAAWDINMKGLKHVLDLAKEHSLRVFWPSSIAAFGPSTPKENTPQETILNPNSMYGITKASGELLCNYYFQKFGVDVRSVRYPGLISYKTEPGGGTTDYAVAIYYEALRNKKYTCFVRQDTVLPMMYMPDAIRATISIMDAPKEKIKTRLSYNLAAMSFSAKQLAEEIKKHILDFKCSFVPDSRQKIADGWPKSIDDKKARKDWGWKHEYNLEKMTIDMLEKLRIKLGIRE
ncbi:MAG TPA: NAD-dependent epimerase/dehydratase family protein [archaeon]|nr:NAD-dependent epimerase/dehydratase family protein [archaeon]